MRCPFLREAQVKYCRASAFRKMIVRTPSESPVERCLSPDYVHCPAAKQRHEEHPSLSRCPFLQESLVQYCSAAPVVKYVPYSESLNSHCGNASHRYCELYVALSQPAGFHGSPPSSTRDRSEGNSNPPLVEGIAVPETLALSPNHMWLDADEDGSCHIGVDGFLTRALGRVEKLSFVTTKGVERPTIVLTVRGADPDRLSAAPYTLGWLFEGKELESSPRRTGLSTGQGLLRGGEALAWMQQEVIRLSDYVRNELTSLESELGHLMTDGGTVADGFAGLLGREELLRLCNTFFPTHSRWSDS
jgi:hypothetical protein